MIDLDDFYIRVISDLPINEMITPSDDGYSVYIKEELSDEKKEEALYHAYMHAKRNDFSKESVQHIEGRAHYDLDGLSEFRKTLKESRELYDC